ncbi:maleylpyruvate isomerase family mycothiol-dependent enzyme [Streptomyces sp. P9(2023)]|uniref:maleylpyruvate isomerase family mycothiol-dependent enzyme n=1 Tax=Streptomyces sp. P9(2023) TaxID=3064394 RepID=UPI0028F439CE|nr:maleylpyruvate isomerase family mycothiol-dependent enzyme [Streptomyces sp. P9(2023)]MDT9687652.1 maleylpyruvate isomerase family mycothiol-dependent enzyme [Streptomyces sp. P9(2023)]
MSDALLNTLAEALAELVTVVETSDEDTLDPDTAVKWLESTAHLLGRLPAADRRTLDGLFRDAALRQPPGPWREELGRVSEGLGLTRGAHERYCDEVEDHVRRFVATVRDADPATLVPTCPGWTLADLVRHHGTSHRWMDHLVRTKATARVRSGDVELDLPDAPEAYPAWLERSAAAALETLRAADPDAPMWSLGPDPHVRFFPRRLLHEAVVHLADAELALGLTPRVEPATAADGIDEFLENLPYVAWVAEPVAQLDLDGARLRLSALDTGVTWTLAFGGGGFTWQRRAEGPASTTVEASTGDLLLLLYGRVPADDPRYTLTGDLALLDDWCAATAF